MVPLNWPLRVPPQDMRWLQVEDASAAPACRQAVQVLADMRMPGLDGGALLARLPAAVPAIVITSADLRPPPRAAALLRKDELTAERLEFTIRAVVREPS